MQELDSAALDAEFHQALELHQHGRLADAERIYQELLRRQPNHFDALYLCGVIALQTRRPDRATELFGKAIALRPDFAEAHNNLGAALAEQGRPDDALSHYDRAIALQADHFGAHNNRGAALARLGRFADALSNYDRAIALQPGSADAHMNRGATLAKLGRAPEALASFEQAIALRPDFAFAHYNRANALRDLLQPDSALASYDRAIALQPNHAESHNNRGAALTDLGRFDAALSSYANTIALRPGFAEAHNNHGNALVALQRLEEALASYDRAIALKPDHAGAYKNRGAALAGLGRIDAAVADYDRAIALQPDYAEAYADRGAALANLGRRKEALASCDRAIALQPDSPEARFNKGACHLALGDYERGWESYEWRWQTRHAAALPRLPGLLWRGEDSIANRTILVHAEQGFGDSLQFCRYVPMLSRLANVVLDVPRPLLRILSSLDCDVQIVAHGDDLPPFDAWVPMLSLPLAFRTTIETIPAAVPYLHANPEQSAHWRKRLATLSGRKVGLVWAGSPLSPQPPAQAMDRRRSMTLQQFAPLAEIPGLCLISLQKGDAASQTRMPPDGMVLHDWTDELQDYADTAALIAALDLVISVDTSVVHLAGALGKPVWVLNRFDQCWRWLQDRTDSPWYPTAWLFRQPKPGDWASVIRDVTEALRRQQWRDEPRGATFAMMPP
ncbi:MAG: tetratricopeptide repeat protein [Acetobacteraceae bacterium]|jgi:tetratricopeptide (TPR) repeat protein